MVMVLEWNFVFRMVLESVLDLLRFLNDFLRFFTIFQDYSLIFDVFVGVFWFHYRRRPCWMDGNLFFLIFV
jgi:hypothetical protein